MWQTLGKWRILNVQKALVLRPLVNKTPCRRGRTRIRGTWKIGSMIVCKDGTFLIAELHLGEVKGLLWLKGDWDHVWLAGPVLDCVCYLSFRSLYIRSLIPVVSLPRDVVDQWRHALKGDVGLWPLPPSPLHPGWWDKCICSVTYSHHYHLAPQVEGQNTRSTDLALQPL